LPADIGTLKDVVQAGAFTAAGIWTIYSFWCRERYPCRDRSSTGWARGRGVVALRPDRARRPDVRHGQYAAVSAEVQVSWLPAVYPLRKECYTLDREADGVVSVITTHAGG